jgi:hypothetical protein
MADGDNVRIELGFEGGQILSALVPLTAAEELERALGSGNEGAFGIDGESVRYTVILRRVDYMKRFAREARVGFGSPAAPVPAA